MLTNVNWLGKTPDNICELTVEELQNYFAYIYEYFWNKEIVDTHGSVEIYLKNIVLILSDKELSNKKLWWGISLLVLRDLTKIQNYSYMGNVIDNLLDDLESLNIIEIEDYCNKINRVFLSEGIKSLVVRPFEMDLLCGEEAVSINRFRGYLNIKDDVEGVLKDYITEDKLNLEYIDSLFFSDRTKTKIYSPVLTQYTEYMFSFFSTAYEKIKLDKRMAMMDLRQKIGFVIGSFLEASLIPEIELDELKDKLTNMFDLMYK